MSILEWPNIEKGRYVNKPPTITASYEQGDIIDVTVNLTANHGGFFVFQLCPADDASREVDEDCLNDNNLQIVPSADGQAANSIEEINLNSLNGLPKREERNESEVGNHLDDGALLTNLTEDSYESYDGWNGWEAANETNNAEMDNKIDHPSDNPINNQTDNQMNNPVDNPTNNQIGNQIDEHYSEPKSTLLIRTVKRYNLFNPVDLDDHSYDQFKYQVPFEAARSYTIKVKLPNEVSCERCVLRWIYVSEPSN